MPDMTLSRKQRLRTLENEIRSGMEEFYYTGMKLKEIRDDELFKEDGFDTWEKYVKERWEWTRQRAHQLIVASEYRQKLPTSTNVDKAWSEATVRELTRIEDKRDAAKVAAKVVKAVEQSEAEAAKDPEVKPLKLTAATVRKFVDSELGVDRSAKSQETKQRNEEERYPQVRQLLIDLTGQIEGETAIFRQVDKQQWTLLAETAPKVVKRLITAAQSLADFLREVDV